MTDDNGAFEEQVGPGKFAAIDKALDQFKSDIEEQIAIAVQMIRDGEIEGFSFSCAPHEEP